MSSGTCGRTLASVSTKTSGPLTSFGSSPSAQPTPSFWKEPTTNDEGEAALSWRAASRSRATPTRGSSGGWYPSDGGVPFPLVVFVHGYGSTPATYAPLLQRIASSGYVVAAATYPLLSGQPAGPTDTVGWADLFPDTSFVTSQVLTRSASGDPGSAG